MSVGIVAPPVGGVPVAAAATPAVVINTLYYNPVDDHPASDFIEFRNSPESTMTSGHRAPTAMVGRRC